MKYIVTLQLFIFFHLVGQAQIKDGTYKSTKKSFRENYFLVVEGDKFTLLGWEPYYNNDTLWYRSTTKFNENNILNFEKFDFSKQPFLGMTIKNFKPDPTLRVEIFVLHKYLSQLKQEGEQISLMANKEMYDSRTDEFFFEKIK